MCVMGLQMKQASPILFYDGYCGLCIWSVKFVLRYEKRPEIKFASLQSDFARVFLASFHHDATKLDTVVFYLQGKIYTQSKAIFKIATDLKFPYKALSYFRFIPQFITDGLYQIVVKYRYKIWGRNDSCYIDYSNNRFIG